MSTKLQDLFQKLEEKGKGNRVEVKLNNNRHTMLSVKWERQVTKISLHRIFLKAPKNIMDAVACYVLREHKSIAPEVKAFIEQRRSDLDYSYLVDPRRLEHEGKAYNLKKIYERLNKEYFGGHLQLAITWFGNGLQKSRSRCSLGLYYDTLKLIKIHRLLDNEKVPKNVIDFVVYHEMVHAVCPAYIDEKGIHRVHGSEFKKLEEGFPFYQEATEWIKKHKMNFFIYGRS